jgi:hypothetical protein
MTRRTTQAGESPVHDLSRARIIQGLRNLHTPYDVYEACGHNHALNDPLAQDVPGIGMVCDKGIVQTICNHCCADLEYGQRDVCATDHKHLDGYALCPTMAIVEGREAPWRP